MGNINTGKHIFRVTTIYKELVNYFRDYAIFNTKDLQIKKNITNANKTVYSITSQQLTSDFSNNNLLNNRTIIYEFKCTSKDVRLKLLAGLIDSYGYKNNNNTLTIIEKNKKLANDILFLIRSLGFRGIIKRKAKTDKNKEEISYYKIIIINSGNIDIPNLLKEKKLQKNKKNFTLNTSIKIIPLKEDKYYGFQIDGNSRFLLGDFTVTHNTSLAKKGIAKCLKDVDGESRPFSFIALGGSSNGSILDGHNYTYVGSTWGKIVDILIEHKCMNPIIFIDELDKVSRTEHGREIIGILTHLIDSTQNSNFQDKYFSNIDLDLSKVLFIFSYNDVDLIDRILLDRIHRIKFDNLYMEDKLIISKKYLLPELYKNFGIENILNIDEDIIKYLIVYYTNEPGVRKLKELFFEIISTINLDLLKNNSTLKIPVNVTIELIEKILKDKHKIKILQINNEPEIGLVNGLWANAYGHGGMLNIEASFFLTSTYLELKLTGMQGDVMKESMAVSKTLALSLIVNENLELLNSEFEKTKNQGIHIHVPEGATPKDGPSAGAAITLVIYSLLTKKKIRNNFAITGEICLRGSITAIGGLELKVLGGFKSGIRNFIYPDDNLKDFKLLYEKHSELLNECKFYNVKHINEVMDLMLI